MEKCLQFANTLNGYFYKKATEESINDHIFQRDFLRINMCDGMTNIILFLLGQRDREQCQFNLSKVAARLLE